jgi:hypothetical protein
MTATTPPFEPLVALTAALERAGVRCVLGGSGLLAALGCVDRVNDWDLQTDASEDAVRAALEGRGAAYKGGDTLHADSKFTLAAERAEVICRFAFFAPLGVIRLPALAAGAWRGVPLASPEVWAVAYALLGAGERSELRRERAEMLFTHLTRHGADARAVRALLAQPLPPPLAARLAALPAHEG